MPRTETVYNPQRHKWETHVYGDQYAFAPNESGYEGFGGGGTTEADYIHGLIAEIDAKIAAHPLDRKLKSQRKRLVKQLAVVIRKYGGMSGLGATKKLVLKPPTPAQQLSTQESTNTRNMLIGFGAVAILGSLAFYIFNKKG